MKSILLILTLSLTSCGLFTAQDPAPALVVLQDLNSDYVETLQNFTALVEDLEGITAEEKAELLSLISTKNKKRGEQIVLLDEFLNSLGDVNWDTWGEEFFFKYLELKTKSEEGN